MAAEMALEHAGQKSLPSIPILQYAELSVVLQGM